MKKTTNINGTSLQGYVRVSVAELIRVLDVPHRTYGDKTTMEWAFVKNGVVFTIYDYKEGSTPLYEYDWHIGGHDIAAVSAVRALFPNKVRTYR